jgi:hypothetical protein
VYPRLRQPHSARNSHSVALVGSRWLPRICKNDGASVLKQYMGLHIYVFKLCISYLDRWRDCDQPARQIPPLSPSEQRSLSPRKQVLHFPTHTLGPISEFVEFFSGCTRLAFLGSRARLSSCPCVASLPLLRECGVAWVHIINKYPKEREKGIQSMHK